MTKQEDRFWSKVQIEDKFDGCWNWMGTLSRGYGVVYVGWNQPARRPLARRLAHRVAYESRYGPIPDELCVCHSCDNPRCVRVDHLFLGTKADNSLDMVTKNRQSRGERHSEIILRVHPRRQSL